MAISPVPMTKRDKRDAAVAELLSSEASYVSDMKLLVDVFVLPLERWAAELEALRDADSERAEPLVPDLTQDDCTQIFANAKQLANFNRQFLVDLRKAYGGPRALRLEADLVSPVYRDSGDWSGRRLLSLDDQQQQQQRYVTSTVLSTYGVIAADAKLDDDPFKAPVAADADTGPRQMLEVFLKSAPFLKMYSLYVNNFDGARERLSALERDNPSFAAFLTACEKQKPCRGLHLRDFLILPVQRIPRYRLLLETILQHTPIESSMHFKVEESLSTMGGIASKINDDVALQRQKDKVYQLQQEFGGADFLTASRLFVKEGDLTKVARNGLEKLHFVLFNDLLVYGQAKKRRGGLMGGGRTKQLYHHRREIKLSRCFVVDKPSYGRSSSFLGETGMLVVAEEKTFMVMAPTAVDKDAWLQAIRSCMKDLSAKLEARERLRGMQKNDSATATRSPVSSLGRSSRWSIGSSQGPPLASAPRSVWVPGKDNHKSVRLVDFSLPAWAGVRASCGCLSHTELTWGKEGVTGSGGLGMAAGLAAALGMGPMRYDTDIVRVETNNQPRGSPVPLTLALAGDGIDRPREISCFVSMRPSERMGLRLRDVHPGCGGGVVVVGFESKSAGKRGGVLQGDRITRVEGFSVNKTADIVWALSQPYVDSPSDTDFGRTVHLEVIRGFPNSDRPWLPPLEPSPVQTILSPPSSAVESRSDEGPPPSASEMSAPDSKTFNGDGAAGRWMGFGGGGGGGISSGSERSVLKIMPVGAAVVDMDEGSEDSLGPPSPETKGEYPGDSSGDFSCSGEGTGDSADSSAGRARGPAPQQANVNAGGDPAKPFFAAQTKTLGQGSKGSVGSSKLSQGTSKMTSQASSLGMGSALAACWTCQTDDPFQISDDEEGRGSSRPRVLSDEINLGQRPIGKLSDNVVAACVGGIGTDDEDEGGGNNFGNEKMDDDDDDDYRDTRSEESGGSSDASSLFLTAVSPSRIPPPLVSIASSLPLPPISRTSSVVSGSFSNQSPGQTCFSPTASNAETPDNSMPWLRPLPPPPPRTDLKPPLSPWEPVAAPTHSPPPPASARGMGMGYPSGRWVQTPPFGEPKVSPGSEMPVEDARGF